MFGWGDFREDGKLREENRVENIEKEKPGRKFSLPGPQFSSSQIGRKIVGRKVDLWHFYTNALSHLPSFSPTFFFSKKKKHRVRAGEKERKNENC